jgi:UDP:flavonoid glycosyltransferase YjiC (YdhE family)
VIAATAGRINPDKVPGNAFVADYLSGEEAARRASLVICNGGSPTTQQALAAGVPVLGLPSNLDQYLNMEAIKRTTAGDYLRAGQCESRGIRDAARRLLYEAKYVAKAKKWAETCARRRAQGQFLSTLKKILISPCDEQVEAWRNV